MSTDDDGGGGKPPAKGESRGDPLENFSKQVNSLLQPLWELMAKLAEINGDPDSLRVLLELFRKLSEEFSEAQQRAMILEQQGINDPEQQAKEEQAKEKTASRKRKAEEGIASRRIKQQVALVDPSSLVLGGVLTTKPLGYVAETVWFGTNRKKNLSGTIGQVTFDNGRPKMDTSQTTVPRMEKVTLGRVTVHIRKRIFEEFGRKLLTLYLEAINLSISIAPKSSSRTLLSSRKWPCLQNQILMTFYCSFMDTMCPLKAQPRQQRRFHVRLVYPPPFLVGHRRPPTSVTQRTRRASVPANTTLRLF
jgi:hypothetical protein